ncbi:hypothetical protein DFH06DRAFT_1127041 [Mycena polygramma]|nr:hypothetical protein DFH06DRAFT_1127041 [Mycena polygramma]
MVEEMGPPTFEGYKLNHLREPDFEVGVIMDIMSHMPVGCRSATEEIAQHELARAARGERPLTPLEHDANLRWLARYRSYKSDEDDPAAQDWEEAQRTLLHQDPVYGASARGREMLDELRTARSDEAQINESGPDRPYAQGPGYQVVILQLRDWVPVHEYNLRVLDMLRHATITQRLICRVWGMVETIAHEQQNTRMGKHAGILWRNAYFEANICDQSKMAVLARRSMDAGIRQQHYSPAPFPSIIHPFDSHLEARETVNPEVEALRGAVGQSPFQFHSSYDPTGLNDPPHRSPGVVVMGHEGLGVISTRLSFKVAITRGLGGENNASSNKENAKGQTIE